jgi:uncharacterized membrane protein YeaQ/YmgE (transglycosylase-associated protein family)
MFHMIGHIFFGLIVGVVAKLVTPGHYRMGWIATILLGIIGAWVGGLLGRALGLYEPGHPAGFFMALVGAVILLALYGWYQSRSTTAVITTQLLPPASVYWT